MALNFPTGPTSGATYTYSGKTWQWNGYAWDIVSPSFVNTLNGATGNLSITGSANQVTVNTSSPQIVIGLPSNLTVGNLTVTGSLLVSGGITTQISEIVLIEDNIIVLNANVTGGSPTENAGIQVSRGASAAVQLLWNETTDKWTFTNDGSQYYDLPVNVVNTVNGATGPITNVAKTNVSNDFTSSQQISNSLTVTGFGSGSTVILNSPTIEMGDVNLEGDSVRLIIDNGTVDIRAYGSFNQYGVGGIQSDSKLYAPNVNATQFFTFPNGQTATSIVTTVNGATGNIVSIATTGSNTFTGLQTMNAGLTANNLYVTNGVTFASTSVHTGLGTFNGGITSSHLYVTNGATFAARASFNSGLSSANLFVSGGGTFGTSVSISGGTAWHANNDGKGSGLDTDYIQGIPGILFSSNLATGLLYGGMVSVNGSDPSKFDITAGKGQIHFAGASFGADPDPTLTFITWPAQTGLTCAGLTSSDTTWLYYDSSGILHQQNSYYTDDQIENNIVVGALVHPNRTSISLAKSIPNVAYSTDKQYEQFIRAFGPLKVSGHTIQPNGENLKLDRSSGTAFILGRNYPNDPNNPSVISDNAQVDCEFWRYRRGATAGTFIAQTGQTAIDPNNYDDDGTLASVPSNKPFSIQRLFFFPGTPSILGVYYGRLTYASISEAANNIHFEDFTEIENTTTNAIFAGYLIVKKNTTNLTTAIAADDARIIQSGQFRSTTSGGGSVSTNLDNLSDVTITSVANDDLLIYDTVTSQWLNTPLHHIGVTRVNGATGAVSVTGAGAILFNQSGKTGTFDVRLASATVTGVASFDNEFTVSAVGAVGLTSNYVKSVNGLTGTVVGIATTGSNTFTGLQTMNAGLTANNLYVSQGATFASPIQGTAASFTGLVSSTIGFSGSAANLVGNASGLTAGTASKVQIAEAASATYYLALASGVGNTGIFVDTTVPRWSYNTSSGALATTTGSVEAASLIATSTGMFSNTWEGLDGTSQMRIRGPYFDGTFQPIYIGDVNGDANGTSITIDDAASAIVFGANNIDAYGNLNLKSSTPLAFYNANSSNYVAFKGPTGTAVNTTWTLPSADGSSNQVLTTNGSGTLSWTTPSGGGGSKTYAVYTPLDNQPPAANYATIDTRNSIMVLDFDAATDESAVFVGIMPEAASLGSGLKIRINWMATSATSGTCRWGVQIERMNTDEDSDSFDTAATAGSTTNATSGIITTTEITITTIDSVAAGDPFRIKVFRDADGTSGTDDMTGDAELVSVEVRSAA